MSNPFSFRGSRYHYPSGPIEYTRHIAEGFRAEREFPHLDGSWGKRDLYDDMDCVVDANKITNLRPSKYLPYDGKIIRQDPIEKDEHKLHPIEVVIDESVVQEMAEWGRSECGEGRHIQPLETCGFLAGKLMQDQDGRLWTHITKSIHQNPPIWGAPDKVIIDTAASTSWDNRIKELGLIKVGIWHTHPTYEPFQSDGREWGFDADVQATARNCQNWWSVSIVIDPYGGKEYNPTLEKKEGVKQAVIGGYKMIKPGTDPDDLVVPDFEMGWRSVAIGIRREPWGE